MQMFVRSLSCACRTAARVSIALALLTTVWAADALQYTKNYFVSGDYKVAGVGLRGQGVNGLATGTVTISGVPTGADIVAAFLYWETEETSAQPSGDRGFFNGKAIVGDLRGNPNNPVCWSSGGTTGGGGRGRVYRADVLRYLDIDTVNNVRKVNQPYQVRLPDSGGNGNGNVRLTNGASLVVVYRVLTPGQGLRAVVIYDGAATLSKFSPAITQDMAGFYEAGAIPAARMTHIVGNGRPAFASNLQYPGGAASNAFTGNQGTRWDNREDSITLTPGASYFSIQATSNDNQACLTWAAIIASTSVDDYDGDGLLNTWETRGLHLNEGTATTKATFGGCADYPSEPCVNLPGMGAHWQTKDLFVEIDWLQGSDHLHIPKLAALNRIGAKFADNGVQVHFDVGGYGNFSTGGSPYIIPYDPNAPLPPRAGGEVIPESALGCPNAATDVCAFPNRPYAVLGWKIGFRAVKDGFPVLDLDPHFAHNRKDIFHYALFSHALGGPYDAQGRGVGSEPWTVSGVADRPGGDMMVSLGLWRADDPLNCNPTVDCNDHTGSELIQAGTLMHEIGHNLGLSHAGLARTPNCEPNYQSTMNYLYQTRGLTDADGRAQIDFSGGIRPLLGSLSEGSLNTFLPSALTYRVRFFGPPNDVDLALNRATKRFCSNGQVAQNESMRLESEITAIDWSNGTSPFNYQYDVNFDGIENPAFVDHNDWGNLNLRQIGARMNVGGLSTDVGQEDLGQEDLGQEDLGQEDLGQEDLGQEDLGQEDLGQEDLGQEDLGATDLSDVDYDTAISTLDATATDNPLRATSSLTSITLTWGLPSLGQIRSYQIFRTADPNGVFSPAELSVPFRVLTGAPPATTFVDTVDGTGTLYNTKYTYFVQATDINGTNSGASNRVDGIVRHLFVKANDKTRLYGAVNPNLDVTITGLDPGLTGTTVCTTTALQTSTVGSYPITCSGLLAVEGVTYTPGTLVIQAIPLTITAQTNNRVYDGTTSAAAIPQVTGLQGSDTVTNLAEAYTDANAGTNKTLVVASYTVNDGNGGNNYSVTTVPNHTGIITRAPLTATVAATNKVYDKTNLATATCTLAGVLPIDTTGVACVVSSATFSSSNAGTWTVNTVVGLDGPKSGNYYLLSTSPSTSATITKATPAITVSGGRYAYDGLPHPATGSVTGVGGEALGAPVFTYTPGGASAPVEIGAYQAVGTFAGTINYFGVTSAAVSIKIDGFVLTGPMATARSYHSATRLSDGRVLIAGGINASGTSLASAEVYNPVMGTFSPTANNMPNKGTGHTATLLNNGRVLVVGGGNSSSQLYDPASNSWSSAGGMSAQRSYHTATLLPSGKVLIAGGAGNNGATSNSAQLFDPITGNFTNTGAMTASREFHSATLLADGRVLIAGGRAKSGGSYLYRLSAEVYDPVSGTFAAVGNMTAARYSHAAAIVASGPNAGKVLIVGGANSAALASADLFNPSTNTFASTGSLGTARQYLTATTIEGGVLIAGGLNGNTRIGTGEQYRDTTFVAGGTMKAARAAHTATRLNDGSVLIVGGQGSSGVSIAGAELFKVIP